MDINSFRKSFYVYLPPYKFYCKIKNDLIINNRTVTIEIVKKILKIYLLM